MLRESFAAADDGRRPPRVLDPADVRRDVLRRRDRLQESVGAREAHERERIEVELE